MTVDRLSIERARCIIVPALAHSSSFYCIKLLILLLFDILTGCSNNSPVPIYTPVSKVPRQKHDQPRPGLKTQPFDPESIVLIISERGSPKTDKRKGDNETNNTTCLTGSLDTG